MLSRRRRVGQPSYAPLRVGQPSYAPLATDAQMLLLVLLAARMHGGLLNYFAAFLPCPRRLQMHALKRASRALWGSSECHCLSCCPSFGLSSNKRFFRTLGRMHRTS